MARFTLTVKTPQFTDKRDVIKWSDNIVARRIGYGAIPLDVKFHAIMDDSVTLVVVPHHSWDDRFVFRKLQDWYARDVGKDAPFPTGSLLYFRQMESGEKPSVEPCADENADAEAGHH